MEEEKKYAIRKLIRYPDGTVGSVLVDLTTGQQIADPSGYNVLQNQDLAAYEPPTENKPLGEEIRTNTISQEYNRSSGDSSFETSDPRNQGRMGFVEKPGFMGYTNMIPGMLGTASNVVSKGIDIRNQIATDQEREGLGLKPEGFMGIVKSVAPFVGGTDNVIAEIGLDKSTVPVTFGGGLTRDGRTGLTPQEAMKRTQALDQDIVEANPLQVKQAKQEFKQEFPDAPKTGVSEMFSKAKDFLGSLFGRDPTKPASQPKESSFKETQSFGDFLGYTPASKPSPTPAPAPSSRESSGGSSSNGYDSVGTPSNNSNSFGGPR